MRREMISLHIAMPLKVFRRAGESALARGEVDHICEAESRRGLGVRAMLGGADPVIQVFSESG